jgi:uncharacterized protein with ParB-like and HNH nuclease domain
MAFETAITIKETIQNIKDGKYYMPAIQREFVWEQEQIELLFDSLMREYPIGSFLFWDVKAEQVQDFQFYKFIKDYHEKDSKHNLNADLDGDKDIIAILDGQQRLTSLYIALKGSYAAKLPRKRWENVDAFPKKLLYLNLLSSSDDFEKEYDFKFFSADELPDVDSGNFWFPVKEILNFKELSDVMDYLTENIFPLGLEKHVFKSASDSLAKLFKIIHVTQTINFYLEKGESLDKVLNIFIRVNSKGTELSYSDLLLSIATAKWEDTNAREEIHSFVDEINKIGDGFNFNKDFVLKTCLVLTCKDIKFMVDNFTSDNMAKIEAEWENIKKSIRTTVMLLQSMGFSRDRLTSNNAVIPIVYYVYKLGSPANFASATIFEDSRKSIFKFLVIVLLKRTFGGQPDNVLRPIRDVINTSFESKETLFPLKEIEVKLKGTTKALAFTSDEIDNLLSSKYGQNYTFAILAILYPTLDFRNKFEIDHIHPKSKFTKKDMRNAGINEIDFENFINSKDLLANLQLLEGSVNNDKRAACFKDWFNNICTDSTSEADFKSKHYIPNCSLDFKDFLSFLDARNSLLRAELIRLTKI